MIMNTEDRMHCKINTRTSKVKSFSISIPLLVLLIFASSCEELSSTDDEPESSNRNSGTHLFILSGQSNMQGLRPQDSFTPNVEAEFGKYNVIVVMDALGAQPIRRWYKEWKPVEGDAPEETGELYDILMVKVNHAIMGQEIKTVTFVWMQGERDANEELGEVYEESLLGLYDQLCKDIEREDVNFVIGRLSDFDMNNESYPHWTMIRDIQVKVAKSNSRFAWVNTDDLNDGVNRSGTAIENDLHMSADGYKILGLRFALWSIDLINKHKIVVPRG
jgi:hypothetical protein